MIDVRCEHSNKKFMLFGKAFSIGALDLDAYLPFIEFTKPTSQFKCEFQISSIMNMSPFGRDAVYSSA